MKESRRRIGYDIELILRRAENDGVDNLNIALRIDISSEIGTGHFLRMNALADGFLSLGHQCVFLKGEDEPIDYSAYDIVVLDTYQINDDYIAELNSPARLLVCYDDNALYSYDCDVLINANLYANELRFRFAKKTPILLLGGEYALLRREFRESPPFLPQEKASRIFICFGGSDARNSTHDVVCALREIDGIQLDVVLGAYTKNDEEVLALSGENVSIIKTPSAISEIMGNCDIAVTAAGSMVYELASIGIPSIIITQADNQLLVAEYMAREGLMEYAGDWKSVDLGRLKNDAVSLLLDYGRRKVESARLIKTVNRNGAIDAAGKIIDFAQNKLSFNK